MGTPVILYADAGLKTTRTEANIEHKIHLQPKPSKSAKQEAHLIGMCAIIHMGSRVRAQSSTPRAGKVSMPHIAGAMRHGSGTWGTEKHDDMTSKINDKSTAQEK